MAQIQLTKRNYLGVGYVHIFTNNKTGDDVGVECTQEEYAALSLPNAVNPTLEGHTWSHSAGGTIKVDSPTTLLGENEYCDFEGGHVVVTKTGSDFNLKRVSVGKVTGDVIDSTELMPVDDTI